MHVTSENNIGIIGKHQLTFKLIIHVTLVIFVHVQLCMIIPRETLTLLTPTKRLPLILYYLVWLNYFVLSALQLRVMCPLMTGLFTIMGFIPENNKIGARITKINAKAKQKPWKNFSYQGLIAYSFLDCLS